MNIPEILIWESTNALLLIPVVIGIVMLVRWIRRRPAFTESDALSVRPSTRESSLAPPVAEIRDAMVRGSPDRLC
jgi:hypothetical protein